MHALINNPLLAKAIQDGFPGKLKRPKPKEKNAEPKKAQEGKTK